MKGAIAAMLIAAKALKNFNMKLRGSLIIIGVIDEEVGSAGTRRLAEKGFKADFAVVGEPTGLRIGIAHKGDATYEIVTHGKAAHSSIPEKDVNAITKMTKVTESLELYSQRIRKKRDKILGCPTFSIGTIKGGVTTWAVPDSCRITVDRRILLGENSDSIENELQKILDRLKQKDRGLIVEIHKMTDMAPMEILKG